MGACMSVSTQDDFTVRFPSPDRVGGYGVSGARNESWSDEMVALMVKRGWLAPRNLGKDDQSEQCSEECPICMQFFSELNQIVCCDKKLCTECLVQIGTRDNIKRACPFCKHVSPRVRYDSNSPQDLCVETLTIDKKPEVDLHRSSIESEQLHARTRRRVVSARGRSYSSYAADRMALSFDDFAPSMYDNDIVEDLLLTEAIRRSLLDIADCTPANFEN
ncbi:hypothetical protein NDN08_006799 [Rhodosorus marinus]|uniref:RING-type domain-containing protein n=1 Tax=Rhodosorus marinus TaxID=101924 RepID=A0AAV8UK51_9RHOD|nr:hypothetical protein NDN08_006799 [Rhodosorus marinus]